MTEQEFAELAAGHALDALSPVDEAAYQTALAAHPEWAAIAEQDAAAAAFLADGVAEVAPPAGLRDALVARIAEDVAAASVPPVPEVPAPVAAESAPEPPAQSSAPSTEEIQTVERRTWTRGLLALAASVVLLVGIGFGAATIGNLLTTPPAVSALAQIEDAPDAQEVSADVVDGGTATLHWSESVGKAVLVSDGLPEITDEQTFQLWFVRDDGAVSAGTFTAEDGETAALLEGDVETGDTVAVTVEQAGGSPTGQPTTEPITAIPTA
ncbi:anti-sigma factor [Microbacterium terricola]|uniref:Regulator of SigK n=1 Tax=Microbacterium terricola TaxID=344163 RepID=A0ABM8E0N6_9MICO|nr:anti-sigma factor [Microbacterium terricola]UYK40904.1 anti-sigma factor [Microbacterium terricola]BDV31346.1 hypothetical protein Microterr_20060 [Microbacterium terricola]